MNDHLKAQQVLNDSMSKLREMFQTWLQQRQEQVVNLDTYTPEPSQCRKIPICYDDDDDEYSFATQEYLKKFSSAITPDLPKSDSLIMEDKHLDTIPEPESDELIKSSVEDLVHTPSESDGISESECDLPVCDDSSPKKDEVLDDIISIPPGNEVVEIVIPEVGGIDTDILLTIKDDILHEKLLNVNLLIAKIEALKDNPTPISDFVTKRLYWETTSYLDLSLPDYEAFFCDSEPDSGNFTMDVVEDIFDNPTRETRVHVPNVLPIHLTL
ncbi:hypothetical protein Tco_0221915 [Tanacetum coccineum]